MREADVYDVAIVDYGLGNLFSVQRACERVGLRASITTEANVIHASRGIILPGVGAFGDAMQNLERLGLVGLLRSEARSGKPLIGICLGMQLLMSESEEFGRHRGLDLLPGRVVHLGQPQGPRGTLKVPEVCWNRIRRPAGNQTRWEQTPLDGLPDELYMYFVHSFYVLPTCSEHVLATTRYGNVEYCSAVHQDNIVAFQFHPERSGIDGIRVYENIARFVGRHPWCETSSGESHHGASHHGASHHGASHHDATKRESIKNDATKLYETRKVA